MEDAPRPTIKGLFVNSHIATLKRERGQAGVDALKERFGKPVSYRTTDDVPVADEVAMLEYIVDITSPVLLSPEERRMEAGRLHFRNFSTTILWAMVQQIFGTNFKFLVMQSSRIASWVFKGIDFQSEDLGGHSVRISMFNNDYPLAHFHGFFEQWLRQAGVEGYVDAAEHTHGRYEYTITWK
jgi:uncharacterized protein (TIGR02265 family)